MRIVTTFACFLIAGTLSFTIAQEQIPSKDELIKIIPGISNIPGFAEFNTSSVKTEDFEKALREKCEKNGGTTAFDTAKQGPIFFSTCLQSLVNVTELQSEMQNARPRGELDEVFQKYCSRVPNLKKCVQNVTTVTEPCLDSEEQKTVKIVHNITDSLLEFICFNEGDRIAMFIAAGGIECFQTMRANVSACANESFGSYIPATNTAEGGTPGMSSIPQLVLSLKECMDIEKFKTCSVKVLEECADPTPANVVDSLLNFVKRVTPCEMLLKDEGTNALDRSGRGGSSGSTNIINVLLVTTAMAMSLRFA